MTLTRANPRAKQRWGLLAILAIGLSLSAGAVALALVNDTHQGAFCDVQVPTKTTSKACTTTAGAKVTYIGDSDATLGSSGTGTFTPFVRLQGSPNERGYNTNGAVQFETKGGTWTHAILVSDIPVVNEGGQDYWELFVDINEGNSAKNISLNEVEIFFTNNASLVGYPFSSPPAGTTVSREYDFSGSIRINDVNQGSGRGDLRYLVPLQNIAVPASCDYLNSACTTFFVLYSQWGTTSATYSSEGGFEEWKVKVYPVPPRLKLVKNVVNDDGGAAVPNDWNLTATGTSLGFTDAGGSNAFHVVAPGVQYTLSETSLPGYTAGTTWSCVNGTFVAPNKITVANAQSATCTITNTDDPPHLTLTKTVVNDDGGTAVARDFTLSASGATRSFSLAAGSSATSLTGSTGAQLVTAGVQYTLSENAVAGYTASGWTCTGSGTSQGTGADANKVTVALGGSGTCAITNDDNTPTLALTKTVVNNDGGTAVARDFTLSANGTSRSFSLAAGSDPSSLTGSTGAQSVSAGVQYTLSETGPANYTASAWTCSGTGTTQGTGDDANKVTIALGGSGTCAITNTDDPPHLTLSKTVVNTDGGTAVARDFTLKATGSSRSIQAAAGSSETSLTGSTGAQLVTAGVQYTLSEIGVSGYTASAWTCSGTGTTQGTGDDANKVTIALGGSGTCAITNTDDPPQLTLTKTVVNDEGGAAVARDFTLSASGTTRSFSLAAGSSETSLTGSTGAQQVTAGVQYTLSENAVAGYTASPWTCSGTGTTQGTGADANKVTIALGGSGTCAITNNDSKASPVGTTVQSWVLHDSLSITGIRPGAANAGAARVTFRLFSDDQCETQIGEAEQVSITAGSAETSDGVAVTATGFYYWTAHYNGDQFNNEFTTKCGDEVTQIQAKDALGTPDRDNLILPD